MKKNEPKSDLLHLCYDCAKPNVPGQCDIYESITSVIEDNFDTVKILFNIPECEYFIEDTK